MKTIIITSIFFVLTACTENTVEHQIQCASKTVVIKFNETLLNVAIDNNHYQLKKVVSASGIKYQNPSALVWLKGNNAIITIGNTKLKDCKIIDTP